jgi:hypothetical protein
VQGIADKVLFKPVGTVNIPVYWFAVGSVSSPHLIYLISHLFSAACVCDALMSELRMEAVYSSKMSIFTCEAQSHISENHNLTNRRCEKLKPFTITGLSVMKPITKQLIGVDQYKSYVIIPLHQLQEI